MKKLFIALLMASLLVGCGKDGSVGPKGERGETGEQGISGTDGSRIFSGAGAPETSLGRTGDFYFRTSNGDFYGPKTTSGWGTATNLRGTNGATGAAGSKILSGTGVPTNTVGSVGDFYLHITTANIYGPKTASGWGSPIMNLRGTSNVIYSDWIRPTATSWNGSNTARYKQMIITEPRITTDILTQGVVLMYRQTNNGTTFPLPYSVVDNSTGTSIVDFTYLIRGNSTLWLMIRSFSRDIQAEEYLYNTGGAANHARFRYVIIPGGVSNTASTERDLVEIKGKYYSKSDLEKMNYEDISKLLRIDSK